jgi:threonine/homoserine/homoserine lactone efflux protein
MIKGFVRIFIGGFVISFLGSLPLGPLNLLTAYLTVSKGIQSALSFSFGSIVSELILVRLGVIFMNWISQRQKLFKVFEWISVLIILVFAVFSFTAAIQKTGLSSAMPANIRHPFWSGIVAGTFDPTRVPFWFTWTTILLSNRILIPGNGQYNSYVAGIALGSLLGFFVFIYGGNYFIETVKKHENMINWTIGGILLITAIIQIYRTLTRKENDPGNIAKVRV